MNNNFDIVIIGGGIYGCTCAYYLAKQNRKVLLIEKNRVGTSGATGYSRGIVRVYDPDEPLAEISLCGALDLLNWDAHKLPGISPYTDSGFLYLLDESKEAEAQRAIAKYGNADYPMELISAGKLTERFSWIKNSPGKIGLYEKRGGYGDPRLTAQNFMEGFRAKGGVVYENCAVQSFEQNGNGSWNIQLPFGSVHAQTVLFTTGAFTKTLLPDLPVFTRSIALTQVSSSYTGPRMTVVDECVETYLRPGDDSSFYCGSQVFDEVNVPADIPQRDKEVIADAVQRITQVVTDDVKAINTFTGYDGYTHEKRPVLQFLPNMEGIYVAAGFSGRGYKCLIPVSRQIAAEIDNHIGDGKAHPEKTGWRVNL